MSSDDDSPKATVSVATETPLVQLCSRLTWDQLDTILAKGVLDEDLEEADEIDGDTLHLLEGYTVVEMDADGSKQPFVQGAAERAAVAWRSATPDDALAAAILWDDAAAAEAAIAAGAAVSRDHVQSAETDVDDSEVHPNDKDCLLPTQLAAGRGAHRVLDVLLARGAAVANRATAPLNLAHLAAASGSLETLRVVERRLPHLLQSSSSASASVLVPDEGMRMQVGSSVVSNDEATVAAPLFHAATPAARAFLQERLLVSGTPSPSASPSPRREDRDGRPLEGFSPLQAAAFTGDAAAIPALLAAAGPDATLAQLSASALRGAAPVSPLLLAIAGCHPEAVAALLAHSAVAASVRQYDSLGWLPIHYASLGFGDHAGEVVARLCAAPAARLPVAEADPAETADGSNPPAPPVTVMVPLASAPVRPPAPAREVHVRGGQEEEAPLRPLSLWALRSAAVDVS
jgi:ankyrin repeat protein